jgi:hypothetical protein
MSLSNLKIYIQMAAVVVGLASGVFWIHAASINPPWAAIWATTGGPAPELLQQQLRRQGRLNACAAFASGVSALLQWIALAGF